mmetsp:Transcript_324/g.844  ORF Transcript_324/g.844 Transcript_324/m.844 type:complete len:464 (+) Transcript_324:600-1991(+)
MYARSAVEASWRWYRNDERPSSSSSSLLYLRRPRASLRVSRNWLSRRDRIICAWSSRALTASAWAFRRRLCMCCSSFNHCSSSTRAACSSCSLDISCTSVSLERVISPLAPTPAAARNGSLPVGPSRVDCSGGVVVFSLFCRTSASGFPLQPPVSSWASSRTASGPSLAYARASLRSDARSSLIVSCWLDAPVASRSFRRLLTWRASLPAFFSLVNSSMTLCCFPRSSRYLSAKAASAARMRPASFPSLVLVARAAFCSASRRLLSADSWYTRARVVIAFCDNAWFSRSFASAASLPSRSTCHARARSSADIPHIIAAVGSSAAGSSSPTITTSSSSISVAGGEFDGGEAMRAARAFSLMPVLVGVPTGASVASQPLSCVTPPTAGASPAAWRAKFGVMDTPSQSLRFLGGWGRSKAGVTRRSSSTSSSSNGDDAPRPTNRAEPAWRDPGLSVSPASSISKAL